jgi:hypothetical protein
MRGGAATRAADDLLKKVVKAVEATGKPTDFIATSLSLNGWLWRRDTQSRAFLRVPGGSSYILVHPMRLGQQWAALLLRVSVLQGRGRDSGYLCIRDEAEASGGGSAKSASAL